MNTIILDGNSLTVADLSHIAYDSVSVTLSKEAAGRVNAARRQVEQWIKNGETIYGVTTGFGEFSTVLIDRQNLEELQHNLILSHAAGAGDSLPVEVVKAMMALRVNALAKGHSGIRLETLELLLKMLNKSIIPIIPSQGSVGASGDLVQLAHLVLSMMGKGKVWGNGKNRRDGSEQRKFLPSEVALRKANLKPVRLSAKEGLALINGTQMMTAYAALAAEQAAELCKIADIAGSMSVEALRGSDTPFDDRIQRLRPYKGQSASAKNLRRLMHKSEIRESHRYGDPRVQDAYSLRCIPQVHGASRDAVEYVYDKVAIEINSANDNPLIFPDQGMHLEGGNFHGQPMALAMDFLAIAMSELANISERRIERLVNGLLSGLPKFLTTQGGLNSGLMIAQYTAASIVSENKVLCHPASVDSIPTSANQEDHNSMGSISAQKAWKVLQNAQTVLAIELMCASQGLDFARRMNSDRPMKSGKGVEAAFAAVRKKIAHLDRDRILYDDIQKAVELVHDGSVLRATEKSIGPLD
ncbi:MAG: histidine ammonia-lyase [Ignavibacteriales bacterium]|nr:histidine ammonia-lyase [Ignavibacteriales bacterium]